MRWLVYHYLAFRYQLNRVLTGSSRGFEWCDSVDVNCWPFPTKKAGK